MKARRILLVLLVIVVLVVALPVSNLIVGAPTSSLGKVQNPDPEFAKALDVLQHKCVNCHTTEYKLPLYAGLPFAQGLIKKDIELGLSYVNYLQELQPADGKPVSEVVLAKTEQVIAQGEMPPARYTLMHWDARMSQADKDAVNAWIHKVRKEHYATGLASSGFENEAVQPIPQSIELDQAKVALGDRIYHDKRLSKDDTLACASCHAIDKGGTDQAQYSTGVGGQLGGINAPTTFNSGYCFVQFWDGRAATLEEQANGPVNNPIEMASNWDEVFGKLSQDADFMAAYTAVYPDGLSKEHMVDAIAVFERSLITPNSKFDKYLMGDASALTDDEKKGYQLFKDFDCATCHVGKAMGAQSFEKMGRKGDYFVKRGNPTDADKGRFNVTKNEADMNKFKVPTLRNIAKTMPYLHDGTTSDLAQVVRIMADNQVGKPIDDAQTKLIVAFLNTLTGEYKGQPLQ
ncbi:MAG: cytochrome-c peroxidase [Candidatus Hydrogenedentes bacterium]|nr:cytochrome-c peroxidase [Candidatus Hydrogenedentota bacterium]